MKGVDGFYLERFVGGWVGGLDREGWLFIREDSGGMFREDCLKGAGAVAGGCWGMGQQ